MLPLSLPLEEDQIDGKSGCKSIEAVLICVLQNKHSILPSKSFIMFTVAHVPRI